MSFPCNRVLAILVLRAAFASVMSTSAVADPVGRAVRCGSIDCGQMVIRVYERFEDGDALPAFERKGVSIRGRFRPGADRTTNFRFLQAFTQYWQDDVRWLRDPAVSLPPAHIDPPPLRARGRAGSSGERRCRAPWEGGAWAPPSSAIAPSEIGVLRTRSGQRALSPCVHLNAPP
jgi:hypothetical protein